MDSYNSAYSVLEKRRLAARARYLAKQEEIADKVPEIARISDEITETAADYTLAKLARNEAEAVSLHGKMHRLIAHRKNLLEENGYTEADIEMKYHCDICRDTGFVNGKTCRCMKEEIVRQRQNKLTQLSPAPSCSFDGFSLDYYSKKAKDLPNGTVIVPYNHMKQVYDFCVTYAENFSLSNKSLLMLGNAGLGKTHLACSIAKVCMEKGFVVMYSSAQSLFAKIDQARYTGEDVIGDLLTCDLFILDDLGAENLTTYSRSVLHNIVNTRMIEGKPCIYTTNIISQADLQKRYGEKISSRLMGSCQRLFFIGDDIRIIKNR